MINFPYLAPFLPNRHILSESWRPVSCKICPPTPPRDRTCAQNFFRRLTTSPLSRKINHRPSHLEFDYLQLFSSNLISFTRTSFQKSLLANAGYILTFGLEMHGNQVGVIRAPANLPISRNSSIDHFPSSEYNPGSLLLPVTSLVDCGLGVLANNHCITLLNLPLLTSLYCHLKFQIEVVDLKSIERLAI